jgi:glycosyltransferase involved in cell wall biosynthesis
MENCRVSVALATYNGAKYLRPQLDSIINQTLKPYEIIVSDDHSTDETLNILQSYQDKGLIKFYLNESKGVVTNFKNAVARCATGNYIALSDQDDIWMPMKLEISFTALNKIESEKLPAIAFSDLFVVDESNNLLNKSFFKEIVYADPTNERLESLIFSNKVIGCTIMFNEFMRQYFDDMPDDVCMHDYWLALISFTFGKHYYIAEPLIRYRRHLNNVTNAGNSVWGKIKKELTDYLLNKKIQLDEHIQTVELFYHRYNHLLDNHQRDIMQKFIKLRKSTTVIKRLNSFYNTM